MLVLSRKADQEIVIGDDVRVRILKIKGNTIRIGIEAPEDVRVIRGELEFDIRTGELLEERRKNTSHRTSDEDVTTLSFQGQTRASGAKRSPNSSTEILPFDLGKRVKAAKSNELYPSAQAAGQGTYQAIGYREAATSSLQQNRLKELVQQITRPK